MPKERGSRIHAGLVGPRALIGTRYLDDPGLRREYAAEIAPRTEAALGKVLREIFGGHGDRHGDGRRDGHDEAEAHRPRVLDLGAGTGAGGAAARTFFGAATEVVAVDQIAVPGSVSAAVSADLAAPGPVRGVGGRFDVIIAAHLVNELFTHLPAGPQRIAARVGRILAWGQGLLAPQGTMIILEPALRETSRDLLAVRDQLVAGGGLHVVAPCFWRGPCPALARERDWCHDAAVGAAGPDRRPLARVDFSYLALRRDDAATDGAATNDETLFRIVSDPLVEKGRLRFFGCGPAGRHALVRLDRHRTRTNAAFDDLVRGDVVQLTGTTQANDGRRLAPDTTVQRRPAGAFPPRLLASYVPAE